MPVMVPTILNTDTCKSLMLAILHEAFGPDILWGVSLVEQDETEYVWNIVWVGGPYAEQVQTKLNKLNPFVGAGIKRHVRAQWLDGNPVIFPIDRLICSRAPGDHTPIARDSETLHRIKVDES